ncbi:MAG: hypothetical protein NC302_08925 [Bacteroidales bacterium]|nr:hypothetical protein [Bacteroidales bacterium]MCM1416325.1 hypothetical protein [bacterium]MCM1423262.1 hypothetical protein [bacterium]
MEKPTYFQSALSSFVTDAACGGAVRHLTDIGYTLDQIVERLDYPAPRAKVQQLMMDYLYESRVLLREEPSEALFAAKEQFVQEQDAYGRRTMRKIIVDRNGQENVTYASELNLVSQKEKAAQTQGFLWKEIVYDPSRDGKLTELLHKKCEENGETYSYIVCPFGKLIIDRNSQNGKSAAGEVSGASEESLRCLNGRQREYLQGIRWDQPVLYHRLNQRMLEIVGKLYEAGVYGGAAFFAESREKITIHRLTAGMPVRS